MEIIRFVLTTISDPVSSTYSLGILREIENVEEL